MKVKAEHLLPLVLDFAKQYLSEKDFKKLTKSLDREGECEFEKSVLVKQGGLSEILACYFKHNKKAFKQFKSEADVDSDSESEQTKPVKRNRANSNVSGKSINSVASQSKRIKKGSKAEQHSMMTRRKSSGEWQPKA